ncbi:MAG: S8 family serine peptidase, partial [Planctomycetota bacterium]
KLLLFLLFISIFSMLFWEKIHANDEQDKKSTILVRFKENEEDFLKYLFTKGYSVVRDYSNSPAPLPHLYCLRIPDGEHIKTALQELRKVTCVLYAEPNSRVHMEYTPTDPDFSKCWGHNNTGQYYDRVHYGKTDADINAPEAWDITRGSKNVIVAVLDTGIENYHEDLEGNIWHNTSETAENGIDDDHNSFVDDIFGWNFIRDNNITDDFDGHGTAIAGIIGARANNAFGACGISHNVSIMPVKVLDEYSGGYISDIISGIQYAISNGAHIINASYGNYEYLQSEYDAVNLAREAGVLFVAAAGNEGSNTDETPHYPGCFQLDNIINVGATDSDDYLAYFSNYGKISVHLAAPGEDVYSTDIMGEYIYHTGTSFSSPYVCGVAALIKAANPNANYLQIKSKILSSVKRLNNLSSRILTEGRLDAYSALVTTAPVVTLLSTSADILGPGQSFSLSWQSDKTGYFSINVGGNGQRGSGEEVESGIYTTGTEAVSIVHESMIPDNSTSRIFIIVTDNSWSGFTVTTVLDDHTPPETEILYPSPNSFLGSLSVIRGSATDSGGAGVSTVSISIYDGDKYYNGINFISSAEIWLTTSGGEEWEYNTNSIEWQNNITYTVKAKALDSVNNTDATPEIISFTYAVDTPTVTINSISSTIVGPAQSSTINWTSNTEGSYSVEAGGTGISGTGTIISNGTCVSDVAVYTEITESAILDNSTTRVYIYVTSGSRTGNFSVFLIDDHRAPASIIVNPLGGCTRTGSFTIFGSASDTGGSSVSEVEISIYNGSCYYNKNSFDSTTEIWLKAKGTTGWSFSTLSVPWTNGTYEIRSRAKDNAGNTETHPKKISFNYISETEPPSETKKDGGCSLGTYPAPALSTLLPAALLLLFLLRKKQWIS